MAAGTYIILRNGQTFETMPTRERALSQIQVYAKRHPGISFEVARMVQGCVFDRYMVFNDYKEHD